jgi:uncharacterized NAD-dependent epimerase/dehydratase family protein
MGNFPTAPARVARYHPRMRRYVALAPSVFADSHAKTAHGVIAYSTDATVAVIDPDLAGRTVSEAVPYLASDAPIVASLEEALPLAPTALLIGVAPPGGGLPPAWRAAVLAAIAAGLEIVSGLHEVLGEDAEFAAAARARGIRIWDVRVPPPVPLMNGRAFELDARIVLTVGSDCASGKMTASLELARAAERAGDRPVFVPTGQTGIMIAGWGIAVDRVISDFTAGAAEQLVVDGARRGELLLVEGQGGINHPAYGAVTLGLLYGSAPDALVLVHRVGRETVSNFRVPILSYRELIARYESLTAAVKPCRVVAIALNTRDCTDDEARAAIAQARAQTGLFADDVVRFGADAMYREAIAGVRKTPALQVA